MHGGCALTLLARFADQSCGGGELHGHTSSLSGAELQDLVALALDASSVNWANFESGTLRNVAK